MIQVTKTIVLDEREIEESFIRSPGPGGQNVNKTASAVQLRFDARSSPAIADDVFERLRVLAGRRMTAVGVVVLTANRFRTQERNRTDALERLIELIRRAAAAPRKRKATRPTKAAKQRRLDAKKRRSGVKTARGRVRTDPSA